MLENFEYTFFDAPVAQKFCGQVQMLGFDTEVKQEESGSGEVSFEVMIKGQISDAQAEQIEDLYGELLFGEQAAQIEGNDSGAVADACGVQIQLASGGYTTVAIHPHIMNKILSVLTIEEVQKFLSQVAEDIENPKAGPICRRENLPQF